MGLPSIKEDASSMSILMDFSATSGTSINPIKSKIFLFNNLQTICRNIMRILAILISSLPSTYLGIPLTDMPLSRATWENLLNKLEKILANWTFRSLNLVGQPILVKLSLRPSCFTCTRLAQPQNWFQTKSGDFRGTSYGEVLRSNRNGLL